MSEFIPELRRLHSPDVFSLQNYHPTKPEFFSVFIQAFFGPKGQPGEESFDFTVCSPAWLANELENRSLICGRHFVFLLTYDYEVIISFLEKYARTCIGTSWEECALKLSRIGKWEFEDYIP